MSFNLTDVEFAQLLTTANAEMDAQMGYHAPASTTMNSAYPDPSTLGFIETPYYVDAPPSRHHQTFQPAYINPTQPPPSNAAFNSDYTLPFPQQTASPANGFEYFDIFAPNQYLAANPPRNEQHIPAVFYNVVTPAAERERKRGGTFQAAGAATTAIPHHPPKKTATKGSKKRKAVATNSAATARVKRKKGVPKPPEPQEPTNGRSVDTSDTLPVEQNAGLEATAFQDQHGEGPRSTTQAAHNECAGRGKDHGEDRESSDHPLAEPADDVVGHASNNELTGVQGDVTDGPDQVEDVHDEEPEQKAMTLVDPVTGKKNPGQSHKKGRAGARGDPLLSNATLNQHGLYFSSFTEAEETYNSQARWTPPLLTYDLSEEEMIDLVKRLRDAILDMSNILDTKNERIKRFKKMVYEGPAIEHAARRLLDMLIRLHHKGWTEPILDPTKLGEYEELLTFEHRFNDIEDLLKCRKMACKALFDGISYAEIVAGPNLKWNRYVGNQKGNEKKGTHIRQGRIQLNLPVKGSKTEQGAADTPSYEHEDDNGNPSASAETTTKRRRVLPRPTNGKAPRNNNTPSFQDEGQSANGQDAALQESHATLGAHSSVQSMSDGDETMNVDASESNTVAIGKMKGKAGGPTKGSGKGAEGGANGAIVGRKGGAAGVTKGVKSGRITKATRKNGR